MKTILVTGGAGFIGSNFIVRMLEKHTDYNILCIDSLTYAGNLKNLDSIMNNDRFRFIRADISDYKKINEIFSSEIVDYVVNFAAETHVDRSIINPRDFLTTNVIGTQVLLDAAKNQWNVFPNDKYSRKYKEGVKFLQVSTDEVYGALGKCGKFVETMPLKPNSPYSASKASADLFVRAYHETFGIPVNITRCSNNYGPHQFPEKLIPLMINNCIYDKTLPIYGDGMQVRDWIHVFDHCDAIDTVLKDGLPGEIYNIGGNHEKANIEIVKMILEATEKPESLITHVKDRPGHDRRYAIDNTKITAELGWKPKISFEDGMRDTITWYLNNTDWIQSIVSGDYQNYYDLMYGG